MKKLLKKIGKGIRTGLKSVGKAFKKVFKGVGKFFGKLGPVGMLGMMILMPQLGAWWGQFGQWAGTLGKGFGTVMRGIHKAGSFVGKSYTKVTDAITGTLNKITGGTFARPGTAGYKEGLSDQFANWMSGQLDKGREFLGLETATPVGTPEITDTDITDVVTETTTVPDTKTVSSAYSASDQQVIDQINSFSDYPNIQESLTVNLSPEGLKMYETSGVEGYIDDFGTLGEGERIVKAGDKLGERIQSAITGKDDISTWDKIVDKGKKGYTTFKVGQDVAKTFGYGVDDIDYDYASFVADNYVPIYEASQLDWTANGYAGTPLFGTGSEDHLLSVMNSTDPLLLWQQAMARQV